MRGDERREGAEIARGAPLAAVTGATGFIGRALVATLAREGWAVRALVRRPPEPGLWEGPAPELVPGDLEDPAALAALVRGADAVIHAAGLVKARGRAEFLRVNVGGAEAVARAMVEAGEAGEARLVHLSSLVAREPQLSDYAASKRGGEEAVARIVPPERLTVVRPPAVYGPADRETFAVFRACARAPVLPMLGPARARVALVHVQDAADEIVRLAARPGPCPPVTLGGACPRGHAWEEIFAAAARAVGRAPPVFRLPRPLLHAAGAVSEAAGRLAGRATIFTRGKAREIAHADWAVADAELGPERRPARFDLDAGFAQTVAWGRASGWLPKAPPA